jgi:hypothetical protein
MDTPQGGRSVVRMVAVAGLAGALLAVMPIALSIELAGGGHGTLVPFHLYFGPVWLVWTLMPRGAVTSTWELAAVFIGMVVLYAGYAGMLALARRQLSGLSVWCACLAIHYLTVICLAMFLEPTDRLRDFAAVVASVPLPWVIVLFEYCVVLHIIGFQYARGGEPFRPRLSWLAAGALLAGMLASLACHGWGRSLL